MVGKITVPPVTVCCQRLTGAFAAQDRKNGGRLSKLNKFLSVNSTAVVFIALIFLLLFVLFITNQKPAYKHIESFENQNIHDDHSSTFQYGVIIDCGSSGSRVFIYYWPPHTGGKDELLKIKQMMEYGKPVRKKIKPGISTFGDKPENASSYLSPLLNFAENHVPHTKHHETPLYILATAGMRLLPKAKQDAILKNLRTTLPTLTKFYFTESQADVISGKQEGIYLWIATNYILDRFDHTHDVGTALKSTVSTFDRKQTVGTIEIGGASLQIAYEIPENATVPPELGSTINLGCDAHATSHEYKIYVTTFLGFGADIARRKYISDIYSKNQEKVRNHESILDPCLPTDLVDEHKYNDTKFKVTGTGEFKRCQTLLLPFIQNKSIHCSKPPCSLNGIYQAPIDYKHSEFYGFAEFWYSSDDVLRIGGKYSHTKLEKTAAEFCKTPWSIHKRHYQMGFYPKADDYRFKYQCFKSAWMASVLHEGLKFPKDYDGLTTVQMIQGKEVQWTLGAILYRMRFLPLREMKSRDSTISKAQQGPGLFFIHQGFYPILFACAMLAIGFVLFYWHRLKKYSRMSTYHTQRLPEYDQVPLTLSSPSPMEMKYPYDMRIEM